MKVKIVMFERKEQQNIFYITIRPGTQGVNESKNVLWHAYMGFRLLCTCICTDVNEKFVGRHELKFQIL